MTYIVANKLKVCAVNNTHGGKQTKNLRRIQPVWGSANFEVYAAGLSLRFPGYWNSLISTFFGSVVNGGNNTAPVQAEQTTLDGGTDTATNQVTVAITQWRNNIDQQTLG